MWLHDVCYAIAGALYENNQARYPFEFSRNSRDNGSGNSPVSRSGQLTPGRYNIFMNISAVADLGEVEQSPSGSASEDLTVDIGNIE